MEAAMKQIRRTSGADPRAVAIPAYEHLQVGSLRRLDEKTLDDLGSQGWSLLQVLIADGQVLYIFKRRLPVDYRLAVPEPDHAGLPI
jgi:hypothetical protein